MFLRFFGWVMATRERKGDKGGKGRADVSRLGTKGGQRRPQQGREGREREAAKHGRDENERDERKRGAAIDGRNEDTRKGDEGRPKTAATRTRGKGGRRAERK